MSRITTSAPRPLSDLEPLSSDSAWFASSSWRRRPSDVSDDERNVRVGGGTDAETESSMAMQEETDTLGLGSLEVHVRRGFILGRVEVGLARVDLLVGEEILQARALHAHGYAGLGGGGGDAELNPVIRGS